MFVCVSFGLASALAFPLLSNIANAENGQIIVSQKHAIIECNTEIRRDQIVESKQSFAIEVDTEYHTTKSGNELGHKLINSLFKSREQ